MADWLNSLGSQKVTLKCDNEPAILALAQEIRGLRREGSITIFEHPEEGEKQSNHLAEGSVNIVKGLIRTLMSTTETNLRTEIGRSHPLIPWIIEHTAQLKNRHMVGADGRTSTDRLRGRGVQRLVYELGEKVLFLPLAPARRGGFGARFDHGIYLAADHSMARRTLEHLQERSDAGQCDSSVLWCDGTSLEQSDDADMADPDSDRRRPRESLGGKEKQTKKVRINVFDGEESVEWVETEEEWGRIHRRPRRDLFSPRDSQGT